MRAGSLLHRRLSDYAASKGVSLNQACIGLLSDALDFNPASRRRPEKLPFGLERLLSARSIVAPHIIGIVLYGSAARGSATAASDVDVLVAVSPDFAVTRSVYAHLDRIFSDVPRLSLGVAHLPDPRRRVGTLWLEAAQEGVVLFERGREVTDVLVAIRRQIAAGRVLRRETHGQGYWVHAQQEPG